MLRRAGRLSFAALRRGMEGSTTPPKGPSPVPGPSQDPGPSQSSGATADGMAEMAAALAKGMAAGQAAAAEASKAVEAPEAPEVEAAAASPSSSSGGGPGEFDWRPGMGEEIQMVNRLMGQGVPPAEILAEIAPGLTWDEDVSDNVLWRLIVQLLSEPSPRQKLPQHNSLDDAVRLIKGAKKILVLSGAGISVSCGIPDFRSKEGIYSRLRVDFPDLPSPEAMFDIHFFRRNPRPFFQFAKEIYPGQFRPSLAHKFVRLLEERGQLLRNYTQNIDTLEEVAGISRVLHCHGSFATASCQRCRHQVDKEAVRPAIFAQQIPRCPVCPAEEPEAILKPDIVFFGEDLPERFHVQMSEDRDEVDLLIVIGSSLKILIDRSPLRHLRFDVELCGNSDDVVHELLFRLGPGYQHLCRPDKVQPLRTMDALPAFPDEPPASQPKEASAEPAAEAAPSPKRPRVEPESGEAKEEPNPVTSEAAVGPEENGAEESGTPSPPPRPRRNLGELLEPDSVFYDEQRARTLFNGCVVLEESSDESETEDSSDEEGGEKDEAEGDAGEEADGEAQEPPQPGPRVDEPADTLPKPQLPAPEK